MIEFSGFDEFFEVLEVIGHGVGKLDGIILDSEIVFEGECFVVFSRIVLVVEVIELVENVEASASPILFVGFVTTEGPHTRFHAVVVERVRFVLFYEKVTRLTMLKRATKLFLLFLTLKLNH